MAGSQTNTSRKVDWPDILSSVKGTGESETPLYARIYNNIKNSIDNGTVPVNAKLPTNRELARLLEVDRSTAARAYSELARDGYIESYVGRGTYSRKPDRSKTDTAFNATSENNISWSQRFSKASNTVFDIFRSETGNYEWRDGLISFSGGIPTFDSYPTGEFEAILEEILEKGDSQSLFEYSPAEGHPHLRSEVLKHLASKNINASEEELLIVSGSQQGIDIVGNVFIDPGDMVALEDPTYIWATCSFKSKQAECLPCPMDEEGIRLDVLENHLRRYRPRLIYVIPNFQNPTGITMSASRRQGLVDLALKHQVPILEDDFVGDLRFEGERLPSLRALRDGEKIVISQGTFSKALCPALRLGWIVAPKEVMTRLVVAKRSSNLSTNSISQIILARYLEKGLFRHHLERVRTLYKQRRDAMLGELRKELSYLEDSDGNQIRVNWSSPDGGMFIWLSLPEGYSTKDLIQHAREQNVSFAPGHLNYISPENHRYLRMCFIQHDEPTIKEGIKRLSRAIKVYIDEVLQKKKSARAHIFSAGGHNYI